MITKIQNSYCDLSGEWKVSRRQKFAKFLSLTRINFHKLAKRNNFNENKFSQIG